MKTVFSLLLTLVAVFALRPATVQAQDMSDKTIAEIAMATDDLSTLVAAVKAADLVDPLSSDGTLTVFAPTNAAFEALPAGVLNALLKPENKATLQKIITYHVASTKLPASAVVNGIKGASDGMLTANTMSGKLTAMMKGNGVALKDGMGRTVNVIKTDIMASNGVVHLIDQVLLPAGIDVSALTMDKGAMGDMGTMDDKDGKHMNGMAHRGGNGRSMKAGEKMEYAPAKGKTIVSVAAGNDNFETLVAAVKAADLVSLLSSNSDFTVFAPTDEAFEKLPEGTVESLLEAGNKEKLQSILSYHVIPSRISADRLAMAIKNAKGYYRLQTVGGESLYATVKKGEVYLAGADGEMIKVTDTGIDGGNGVIHVIDGVLMPRAK